MLKLCSSISKLERNVFKIAREVCDTHCVLGTCGHVPNCGRIVESFFLSDDDEIRDTQVLGVLELSSNFIFAEKVM